MQISRGDINPVQSENNVYLIPSRWGEGTEAHTWNCSESRWLWMCPIVTVAKEMFMDYHKGQLEKYLEGIPAEKVFRFA